MNTLVSVFMLNAFLVPAAKGIFESSTTEENKPMRALIPIDFSDEEKATLGMHVATPSASASAPATDSQARDKAIANQIPTDKAALFGFELNWAVIEQFNILNSIIQPWVAKKIEEYLGENEETLCGFIMTKLASHCSPVELLNELEVVLDSDAEKFVVKLQQILIFQSLKVST